MEFFLNLLDRVNHGQQVSKNAWDFNWIVMTIRRLVEKYQLSWNPMEVVVQDDSLADRIFCAGFEMACETGVYCSSTGRVVRFEKNELVEGYLSAPKSLKMGEGTDARILFVRRPMDFRPPLIWAGNPGVPTPEALFLPSVLSWVKEPLVDLATCGSLTAVDGLAVRTGDATEVIATRRELKALREGLRLAGRPGMGLLAAQSSVSELGDLGVAHPDYLRPCDSHLIPLLNELVLSQGSISRVANSLDYGMRNASLATVMVGGLAGDAPGAAVLQTASFLLANLVCLADYHILHPIHIRHVATSTRSVMWVQSMVTQAFFRNAPCIIFSDIYPKSGAMTCELLYEVAANAIAAAVSGGHLEGVGSADGALPNGTGLEIRLMAEVGRAVTRQGLDLKSANALVNVLLLKYEHIFKLPGGNPGVCFDEAYDLETLCPLPAWEQIYESVKEDLTKTGLDLE